MRKFLLAACAVLAMTGAARGEDGNSVKVIGNVGQWEVVNSPVHCAASAGYQNGTSLVFGVTKDARAFIRVYNKDWNIPTGKYQVAVQVDRSEQVMMTFSVSDVGNRISAFYDLNESAYNLIANGAILKLNIGGTAYHYSLKGSADMMMALVSCAGQVAKAANPFAGQAAPAEQPADPVSTPANPFKRT